ncbi:unnamed protein product [Caretta caretta]
MQRLAPWPGGMVGDLLGRDAGDASGKWLGGELPSAGHTARESWAQISKPLMEKKRRARINVSLEQLKALLEKHYSHHIRKRKLEKADILELSVKYMKSLQNSVQGADYQAGFRSCLHGVNQFLLRSEGASEASSFQLLQELARASPRGAIKKTQYLSLPSHLEMSILGLTIRNDDQLYGFCSANADPRVKMSAYFLITPLGEKRIMNILAAGQKGHISS